MDNYTTNQPRTGRENERPTSLETLGGDGSHKAAANDERFAVEEEIILPDFECGGKCRKYGCRGICKQKYVSHNWPLWSAVIIANHPLRHNTHLGSRGHSFRDYAITWIP